VIESKLPQHSPHNANTMIFCPCLASDRKFLARNHKRLRSPVPHNQAMCKIIDLLVALCLALVAAVTAWVVAHFVFGASGLDIRMSVLLGAAIFALMFALLVATEGPKP
jgi:hypothetical protein